LQQDIAQGLHPEIYLCGPPGLVDATEQVAKDVGMEMATILSEKFLPS
jgi:methane monooxygenase component C